MADQVLQEYWYKWSFLCCQIGLFYENCKKRLLWTQKLSLDNVISQMFTIFYSVYHARWVLAVNMLGELLQSKRISSIYCLWGPPTCMCVIYISHNFWLRHGFGENINSWHFKLKPEKAEWHHAPGRLIDEFSVKWDSASFIANSSESGLL